MQSRPTIYLDYQASTPMDPRVTATMVESLTSNFGNPHSSEHVMGWLAEQSITDALGKISKLIGAEADEIFFTSGATEANNLAILGSAAQESKRKRIIVSSIEHKSVLEAANAACRNGFTVDVVGVGSDGVIDISELEHLLADDVLLVSIIAISNEIGAIQPLELVGAKAKKFGVLFHIDASQAPPGMDLDVSLLNCDMLSLSSHKMYGPKGIGALFIRRHHQSQIKPIFFGGGQQGGIRPGTLPTALCAGFGHAADLMGHAVKEGERQAVAALRDRFLEGLLALGSFVKSNIPLETPRHPGNLNVRFEGHDGRDLLSALQPGIAASTGSACTSGIQQTSYVLAALGLSHSQAAASVRFGVGRFTTEDEIDAAIAQVGNALAYA